MTKPRIGPLRNADLKQAILDYVKDLDDYVSYSIYDLD